jgi:hypothetical protein
MTSLTPGFRFSSNHFTISHSIALVVPSHKSTPSHQRHPRFGIDGELAPERLHLASARPIAGTARRLGSQSLCRPLRANRSSGFGVAPPILKTPASYVQVSPWITIANKQVELMTWLMGELGLSPSSRLRLAVDVQSGPDLSEWGL